MTDGSLLTVFVLPVKELAGVSPVVADLMRKNLTGSFVSFLFSPQHFFGNCRARVRRPKRSALLWDSPGAPVRSAVSHPGVRFRSQQVLRLLPQEETDPAFSASSGFQLSPRRVFCHYLLAMSTMNQRPSVLRFGNDGFHVPLSCQCLPESCSSALCTLCRCFPTENLT